MQPVAACDAAGGVQKNHLAAVLAVDAREHRLCG
jgi:hypothetical protein